MIARSGIKKGDQPANEVLLIVETSAEADIPFQFSSSAHLNSALDCVLVDDDELDQFNLIIMY